MDKKDWTEIGFITLICIFIGIFLYIFYKVNDDCKKKGGFLIQNSWTCIKSEQVIK